MFITGFFFAAVSGNLVGMIGSSNNPLSGLTLATVVIAALTMVIVGAKGTEGVLAVLAVAAVGCVSSAVAGEMLQDLKVGHILGGTPWKMQVGDVIGVIFAGAVMFFPLYLMHTSDVAQFGEAIGGFGGKTYAAPQAGLMAALSSGHRRRRDGLAARPGRHRDGLLDHPGQGPQPDAVLGRDVPAARNDGGDLRRRPRARDGGQDPRQARLQRRAEGARRERRRAGGLGPDRGRGAASACSSPPSSAFRTEHKFWSVSGFADIAPWMAIPVLAFLVWYLIAVPLRKAGAADEPAPPTAIM